MKLYAPKNLGARLNEVLMHCLGVPATVDLILVLVVPKLRTRL